MRNQLSRAAFVFGLAALCAGAAFAQTMPYQQTPSVDLSRATTRWRVDESWNNDDIVYIIRADGVFQSPTGHGGRWVQTGARVVMDWPSYGAIYVGVMNGDRITGTALFDDGRVVGGFVMTRLP